MTTENLELLKITGNEIQNLIRNIKKDPLSRKSNVFYFQERLNRLEGLVTEFRALNAKLNIKEIPEDHEYFTKDYYNGICNLSEQYNDTFQSGIDSLTQAAADSNNSATQEKFQQRSTASTTQPKQPASEQNSQALVTTQKVNGPTPHSNGPARRFTAKIATVERFLAGIAEEIVHQNPQYRRVKKESLETHWQQLEQLYESLWELYEDPAASGVNLRNYIELEERVQDTFVQLASSTEETINAPQSINRPNIMLPKLVIPKFAGDYLKWKQFFDLFSHMVDQQTLPKVQKMYYLKSNVTGEAEKLISHFTVTEDNYSSAWALLQERYNNKRLLTSALIHKILNQPADNGTAGSIKALHDTTQECLLALGNIDIQTDTWDPLLLHLLIKKLDRNTHMRYEQSITQPKEVQSKVDFLSFLELEFQCLEALGSKGKPQSTTSKAFTSIVTQHNKNNMCKLCKNEIHPLFSCKKVLPMTPSDRLKVDRICMFWGKKWLMAELWLSCGSKVPPPEMYGGA